MTKESLVTYNCVFAKLANAAGSARLRRRLLHELQGFALGDHRQQPRVLFAVEGRLGRCCTGTDLRLLVWRAEPEAYVEGMDRVERVGRVLDKGLLIEDAPDGDFGMAVGIALEVGLVPAKAETGEGARIERRMLDQEHIEARVRGESTGSQDHVIVLRTSDKPIGDVDIRLRVLDGRAGERLTGLQARVHPQWERADRSPTSTQGGLWGGGGLGTGGGDPGTDQGRQSGHDKGGQQDRWQQATTEAETMHHWKSPLSMELELRRKTWTYPPKEEYNWKTN